MLNNMELVTGIIEKEIRDCLTVIAETPLPTEVCGGEQEEEDGSGEE